jgi:hypothetical protein
MCREENPGEPDQRGHAINRGWASVQAKRNYEQETPDARNELRALMLADGRNALFKRVRFEGEFEQATLRHQMKILSWWLRKILDHVIVFNESSLYRHCGRSSATITRPEHIWPCRRTAGTACYRSSTTSRIIPILEVGRLHHR